jgi:hypothetical protein
VGVAFLLSLLPRIRARRRRIINPTTRAKVISIVNFLPTDFDFESNTTDEDVPRQLGFGKEVEETFQPSLSRIYVKRNVRSGGGEDLRLLRTFLWKVPQLLTRGLAPLRFGEEANAVRGLGYPGRVVGVVVFHGNHIAHVFQSRDEDEGFLRGEVVYPATDANVLPFVVNFLPGFVDGANDPGRRGGEVGRFPHLHHESQRSYESPLFKGLVGEAF